MNKSGYEKYREHLLKAPWVVNPDSEFSEFEETCVLEAREEWTSEEKRKWPRKRIKKWFAKARELKEVKNDV